MSKVKWSSYGHVQTSECSPNSVFKPLLPEYSIFNRPLAGAQLPDGRTFVFPTSSFFVTVRSVNYFFLAIPFFNASGLVGIVPTPKMVAEIIDIIGEESIEHFCDWHNYSILIQFSFIAEGDLRAIGIYPSEIELCRKLKFCAKTYYYYKAIVFYCHAIFWKGNYSIEHQMLVQDRYRKAINKAMKGGVKSSESFDPSIQIDWLNKITDYVDSQSRFSNYDLLLKEAQHKNPQIQALINQREKEHREWLEFGLKAQQSSSRHLNPPAICQFCGKWIKSVSRFPSSCGASECDRRYEKNKKSKQRGSKTPDGWACIHQRGTCEGCTRRVQLNQDSLCRGCYAETPS
jgi:hypothetical protein